MIKPYFLGDSGYALSANIIVPYPGKRLTPEQEHFNSVHSSTRMCVERAFRMLKMRWRVLNGKVFVKDPYELSHYTSCAGILHNLMSVRNDAFMVGRVDVLPELPVYTPGDKGGGIDLGSTVRDALCYYLWRSHQAGWACKAYVFHDTITGSNMMSTVHPYAQNTTLHHSAKTLAVLPRTDIKQELLNLSWLSTCIITCCLMCSLTYSLFDKFPTCDISIRSADNFKTCSTWDSFVTCSLKPQGSHSLVLEAIMSDECRWFPLYFKPPSLNCKAISNYFGQNTLYRQNICTAQWYTEQHTNCLLLQSFSSFPGILGIQAKTQFLTPIRGRDFVWKWLFGPSCRTMSSSDMISYQGPSVLLQALRSQISKLLWLTQGQAFNIPVANDVKAARCVKWRAEKPTWGSPDHS